MSARRDTNRFKQLLFEAVFGCLSCEIRSQSARLKGALDPTSMFALVFEHEDIPCTDYLTLHTADLADAIHTANAVTAAFDLHHQIDRTGDLCSQRSQWQICRRHEHHVLDPE